MSFSNRRVKLFFTFMALSIAYPVHAIIGGLEVADGEFPAVFGFESQIMDSFGSSSTTIEGTCTGVLVHPLLMLTAAHCLNTTRQVTAVTNAISIIGKTGEKSRRFRVSDFATHPAYKNPYPARSTAERDHSARTDIGYIVLKDEATGITPYPMFVPETLAMRFKVESGSMATLVGYGSNEYLPNGNYELARNYGKKRKGDKRISHVADGYFWLSGAESGAIPGDSGGPLLANIDGQLKLIGIQHAMSVGTREEEYVNDRGRTKKREVPVYAGLYSTMITPENFCWVKKSSKIDLSGVACEADGTPAIDPNSETMSVSSPAPVSSPRP